MGAQHGKLFLGGRGSVWRRLKQHLWVETTLMLAVTRVTSALISDSPKVSPSQFAFVNIKKADGRRWSVASLPR